jgi:hypothetical protein
VWKEFLLAVVLETMFVDCGVQQFVVIWDRELGGFYADQSEPWLVVRSAADWAGVWVAH